MRARVLAIAMAALAPSLLAAWYAPAPPARTRPISSAITGRWTVTFANGVVETCEVKKDGTASVTEPNRTSGGKAVGRGGVVVITFDDDRVERWTAKDGRVSVEHWYPASAYPSGQRVQGIASRMP